MPGKGLPSSGVPARGQKCECAGDRGDWGKESCFEKDAVKIIYGT